MENKYCVYKITNIVNEKVYIGLTKDLKARWSNQGKSYKPKNNNSSRFYNAIKKYGWDSFKKEVLFDSLSREEAGKKEIELIEKYKARSSEFGYNIAEGGFGGRVYLKHPKGMLGKTHTKEWKENHSKSMKGENNPFYGKKHKIHPKGFLNKKHTAKSKEKTSKTMIENKINTKKVVSISPAGEKKIFDSIKECCQFYFNQKSSDVIRKLLKTNKPYKIHPSVNKNVREKLKIIDGYTFYYYKDNSEVCK